MSESTYSKSQIEVIERVLSKLQKEDSSQTTININDKEQVSQMLKNYSKDCECPICLEGPQEGGGNRILECTHFIHEECLQKLIEQHQDQAECPICRKLLFSLPKIENTDLPATENTLTTTGNVVSTISKILIVPFLLIGTFQFVSNNRNLLDRASEILSTIENYSKYGEESISLFSDKISGVDSFSSGNFQVDNQGFYYCLEF